MREQKKYLQWQTIRLAGINLFLWICIGLILAAGTVENGWLLINGACFGNFVVIVWNTAKTTKEANE